MWNFWARDNFFDELTTRPLSERRAVRDALSALLVDPFDPPGLTAYTFRGPPGGRERYVADLPFDWHVTYTPAPNGLPPVAMEPFVVLRSLDRIPDL